MIPFLFLAEAFLLFSLGAASTSPDITTLQEGYNIVAKVPCIGCPYLVQDTSNAEKGPWAERKDDNSLLLNITLSYIDLDLKINSQTIYPTGRFLPKLYANQVLQDLSSSQLDDLIQTHRLEQNSGGAYFGLSYRKSLHRIANTTAFLFRFDILEILADITPNPISHQLDSWNQPIIELILLERPLLSAYEPISYEIIKSSLVARSSIQTHSHSKSTQEMHFTEWDEFGQLHTVSHFLFSWADSFIRWITSSAWGLVAFIFSIILLFILVCAICIIGWDLCGEGDEMDYASAQRGKEKERRRKGGDEETRVGFKTAEELGLLGRGRGGRVVGIGKSD